MYFGRALTRPSDPGIRATGAPVPAVAARGSELGRATPASTGSAVGGPAVIGQESVLGCGGGDDQLAAVAVSAKQTLTVHGVAQRSGKPDKITLSGEKLVHHILRRARMGRVLAKKMKMPLSIAVADS